MAIGIDYGNWNKSVKMGWIYKKRIYIFNKWTPFYIIYFDIIYKLKKVYRKWLSE